MKLRIVSTAEAEATEAVCWYDDQSLGLGNQFLGEYSAPLMAIEPATWLLARIEMARVRQRLNRLARATIFSAVAFPHDGA